MAAYRRVYDHVTCRQADQLRNSGHVHPLFLEVGPETDTRGGVRGSVLSALPPDPRYTL